MAIARERQRKYVGDRKNFVAVIDNELVDKFNDELKLCQLSKQAFFEKVTDIYLNGELEIRKEFL